MDRSTADRLALLLATLAARSARPSGVSAVQHLEHSWPRAPVCARPQAWQLSWTAAASRPAWRSRHRRWRSELVGSGIGITEHLNEAAEPPNAVALLSQRDGG